MTAVLEDPTVRAYLATLDRLLDGAPDRVLIVDGVAQHIGDALDGGPAEPARVRAVLEELGDPATIAAEAAAPSTERTSERAPFLQRRSGAVLTVLLLTVGAVVVPLVGWIVGLGLLWSSKGWALADKLIGTLLPVAVAGLSLSLSYLVAPQGSAHHPALIGGSVVGAILMAVYLLRRFRERA